MEAQELILAMGQARFGPATEEVCNEIEAIQEIERLVKLSLRLLVVGSWSERLGENGRS